ncbi:MAG: hypothetical protein J6Y90_07510 [Lachnospiraceae bacterium]|nr:hypothetical protein [Lachnospiraceae bacterium]
MGLTNKKLLEYAKVFYDHYMPTRFKDHQYIRIEIYTNLSGYVAFMMFFVNDKTGQGISLYEDGDNEGKEDLSSLPEDERSIYRIGRPAQEEYWSVEQAREDLADSLLAERFNGAEDQGPFDGCKI